MPLDRRWIEAHVPHSGRMCLLEEVLDWDGEHIRCRSAGHRAADHPLRAFGRLGIAAGIELVAQTMAVHGALLAPADAGPPRFGMLASLRSVRFEATRLDDVEGDLISAVHRIAGDSRTALYEFSLAAAAGRLIGGRASVVLDGGPDTGVS